MAYIFGLLGFLLSIVALMFAGEMSRRTTQRMHELETGLIRSNRKIQELEGRVTQLVKANNQRSSRQQDTLVALEKKSRAASQAAPQKTAPPEPATGHDRFTPSQFKNRAG